MTKNKNDSYKKILNQARAPLGGFEKILSKLFHQPVIDLVFGFLEKSLFRITPMYLGFIAALVIGLLMLAVAYFYGYQVVSVTVLGPVFALGFVVGLVYEYVRSLVKQAR